MNEAVVSIHVLLGRGWEVYYFLYLGIYSLIANLSLQGSVGGGGRAEEQWKERLAFC